MLVIPAATRRSQTPWAAAAGVAITPIDTPCRAITDSISSECLTTWPAISVATTSGSASKTAATRNPREAKPP